jgi:hypothetical protein
VPNYLKELASEFRLRGRARFFDTHPASSVMIGMGVLGVLADNARASDGTYKFSVDDQAEYFRSAALVDRVWFLVKKPHNRGELRIVVGRTAEADVSIPELSISTDHCAFEATPFGLRLVDLGSTNGTIVDGSLLREGESARLHSGSRIVLGRFEFEYLRHKDFVSRLRVYGTNPQT